MDLYVNLLGKNNSLVKEARQLRKRSAREKAGLFLMEGMREIEKAFLSGIKIKNIFIDAGKVLKREEEHLVKIIASSGSEVSFCFSDVFHDICYSENPPALAAIGYRQHRGLDSLQIEFGELYLILEAVEKPGNLGAVLRCADAVGISAVFICDGVTDIYNPNVIRSSLGTVFTVPVIETAVKPLYRKLKQNGFSILAASPDAVIKYTDTDMRGSVAVIFGSEHKGLSSFCMKESTGSINIPMKGMVDSLNVAMSAGIVLYEALRQRSL